MRSLQAISFALLLMLLSTATAHAQGYATDQGSVILGGSVSLSSERIPQIGDDDIRYTSLLVNPRIEYFVLPGLALGGIASLSHTRFDGETSTAYGGGPRASYFFGRGNRTAYPYLSAETAYAALRGSDSGSVSYTGTAGLLYMLTEGVGLNGSAFYRVQTWTGDEAGDPSYHSMGLSVGVSAFVF